MDCPGPYCSEINLATEFIRDLSNIDKIKPLIKNKIKLKKGIIFELKLYLQEKRLKVLVLLQHCANRHLNHQK